MTFQNGNLTEGVDMENPFSVVWHNIWDEDDGREKFMEDRPCLSFTDYVDRPFDFDLFYSFFPEFAPPDDDTKPQYSTAFISGAAKQAAMFVKPSWCRELDGHDRTYAYLLTVAHMAVLIKQQQVSLAGTSTPGYGATASLDSMPGVITSASVGGVSLSKTGQFQPRSFWEAWYNQTPYGRTLLSFLEQKTAAGIIYEGGENIADCLR